MMIVQEQDEQRDQQTLAGTIGLGLALALWLVSSWRLVFHTLIRRQHPSDDQSPSSSISTRRWRSLTVAPTCAKWMTQRRTFHCLLWMSTSCEALAYADISGLLPFSHDRVYAEKLGYVLLDVVGRSVLELLAFSVVTALWLETAIRASPRIIIPSNSETYFYWNTQHPHRFLLPTCFLVIMILLVISSVIVSLGTLIVVTVDATSWSRAQTLLEGISWGLHAAVVIECVVLTTNRIMALAFPQDAWKQRWILLAKAVLPMLVSAICYALRSGWLIYRDFMERHKGDNDANDNNDNNNNNNSPTTNTCMVVHFEWSCWIGFAWCPTWITVAMLLYSARKRDHVSSVSVDLREPLLGSPVPPAEAFLAFAQNRFEGLSSSMDEFCDDSLSEITPQHPHEELPVEEDELGP